MPRLAGELGLAVTLVGGFGAQSGGGRAQALRVDTTAASDKLRYSAGLVARGAHTPAPCNGVFGGYAFHPLGSETTAELRYGCPYPTGSIDKHYVLGTAPVTEDHAWHTYRLEVETGTVRLFVDDHGVLTRYTGFSFSECDVELPGYHVACDVREFKFPDLD